MNTTNGSTIPALELSHVTKRFGDTVAVNDVSFTVAPGEVVALLGPNGAGKTTALDMALGLSTPTHGHTSLFGMSARDAVTAGFVGVMQQNNTLLRELTIMQTLKLISSLYANPFPLDELIDLGNLREIATRKISKCSGGEQQRIRLAMALIPRPKLLILDEPTVAMDTQSRQEFWRFINHQAEQGTSIVFATHYLAEAQDYAPRTIIMKEGRIIVDENTERLRQLHNSYHLSVTLTQDAAALLQKVQQMPTVTTCAYDAQSQRFTATGTHLDEVVRLVMKHPHAHHLTVNESTLEDAYNTLVSQDSNASFSKELSHV